MLNRRNFLGIASGLAVGGTFLENPKVIHAVPKAVSELGKVKIRDVKTASIRLTYYNELYWS